MSWKASLYDYVHHRNELEMASTIAPVFLFEAEDAVEPAIALRREAFRRKHAVRRERMLRPLQHETRLRLLRCETAPGEVRADIELRRLFQYEQQGRTYVEERIERERVALADINGKWRVRSIAALSGEEAGGVRNAAAHDRAESGIDGKLSSPALPYLNRDVLYSYEPVRASRYNRQQAVEYANRWWDTHNPQYEEFEVDCTNYVSQCLFAGGAPMNYTGKRDSGWWYHGKNGGQELWSYSWAVASSLQSYLGRGGLKAKEVESPMQLTLGDVICYSWDGVHFGHNTIVTAIAADNMPLVNAHTVNSRYRYWDYRDSYAWTERTKYRFFHIADSF